MSELRPVGPGESQRMARRVAAAVAFAAASACWPTIAGAVAYQATFQATWSAATHPGAYPANAHFSPLVGGTHAAAAQLWAPDALASVGIERMAELGSTGPLLAEIQAAIDANTARSTILGSGLSGLPNSTSVRFDVEPSHPLLTLVTMVAPSPDWFLGVHGLSLRNDEGWIGRLEINLVPYDAGTDDGVNFTSPDVEPTPHRALGLLDGFPFTNLPPLGKLILTIQPNGLAGDFNLDGAVDSLDGARWERGSSAPLAGNATVLDGNANGDGWVDGADWLVWQQNFGATLAPPTLPAATVPEPSIVLLAVGSAVLAGTFRRRRGIGKRVKRDVGRSRR